MATIMSIPSKLSVSAQNRNPNPNHRDSNTVCGSCFFGSNSFGRLAKLTILVVVLVSLVFRLELRFQRYRSVDTESVSISISEFTTLRPNTATSGTDTSSTTTTTTIRESSSGKTRSKSRSKSTTISSNTTTSSRNNNSSNPTSSADTDPGVGENSHEFEFDSVVWPSLKQRLCPRGIPDRKLGPALFELARIEFGLAANATALGDANDSVVARNREEIAGFFYHHSGFGFTVYLDGSDPQNSIVYAPIWKCANDQIHAYLHHLFDRKPDGTNRNVVKRKPNQIAKDYSNSYSHSNDTYLESLTKKDLEFLFHEALELSEGRSGDDSYQTMPHTATVTAAVTVPEDHVRKGNDNGGGDANANEKENDSHYFNFNNTSRTKPCVFAVLRDPISHFLSGYNEVEYRLITGSGGAPESSQKTANKLASYTKVPYDEGPRKREQRFETFVRNLLKEHNSFAAFSFYKHFASMSRILPTLSQLGLLPEDDSNEDDLHNDDSPSADPNSNHRNQNPNRWFLPTLENLTEIFPRFMADRCPRMALNYQQQQQQLQQQLQPSNANSVASEQNPKLPPMRLSKQHESSRDGYGTYKAAKDVWKKEGPTSRALCALHAMDYACFEGLELPRLCREVYSSERFVDALVLSSRHSP